MFSRCAVQGCSDGNVQIHHIRRLAIRLAPVGGTMRWTGNTRVARDTGRRLRARLRATHVGPQPRTAPALLARKASQ